MAGVVVVAVLAIAIPAMASGHSSVPAALHASGKASIICPLVSDVRGGLEIHVRAVHHSRRHRRHYRKHHHGKTGLTGPIGPTGATFCHPIPCATPDVEPWGPSGPTGTTLYCRPLPCLYAPQGSTGTSGPWKDGGSGPVGATQVCEPPCRFYVQPDGPSGPSGPTIACWPVPCPLAASGSGSDTPTYICRIPPCPMPPVAASAKPRPLIACPQIAASTPAAGTARRG